MKSLQAGVNLAPVTLKAGSTSELALQAGWNLVSLARQPGDPAPASFFSGAASRVFAYNACDAADPWKVWDPANPSGSDLTAISPKLGLWAEVPAAVVLPVAGTEPATTTIHLCPGWNLIGAPFSQDRSVTGALSSIQGKYARVFGYDAADPADPWEVYDVGAPAWANTLQVLEPGKGYWVFATVETDLVLSNDTTGPVVQISAPADLSEVTTLTNVVGTVSGELIQEWRLAYRALGDAQWTTIASGTTPVVNGVLGVFDPTLLLNGPYQLELTATDANNLEQFFRVDIAVEGQQKIGNFTLTYSDLEVPLSGLPIQILRTYDSRDKRKGDFGVGWTLDIRQGSYRNNRQPGEGWQFASGVLPCQFIRESLGHMTTIRLSDREMYRFKLSLGSSVPTLGGCFAQARFNFVDGPVPGAALTILGNTQVLYQNGDNRVVDASSLEIYEPQAVRLTTRDGRIFDLTLQQGITRLEDQNGNELSITPGGITHSSGRTVAFERDGQGRITRITDPEGESLVYEYDAAGDLVTVTDRLEQATRFTYNAGHFLLDIEDARGIKPLRNEYGADGRLIRNIDAFDKVIQYTHDVANRQETVTDRLGHTRLLEYDARGNVVREVDAKGKETQRTFNSQDRVLTESDPLGHTRSFTYDSAGNVLSSTDAMGNRTSLTYDSRGQLLTVTDARGKVTTLTYDSRGNLVSSIDPSGAETSYTYDARGNVITQTDPEGLVTQAGYDSAGRLIREVDEQGVETTYTYDGRGNRLSETVRRTTPTGSEVLTRSYAYDSLGRLIQATDPDGSVLQMVYDPLGKLLEKVDPLNRRTTFQYDAMGRLVKTTYPDATSESSTYDAEGRVLTYTDRQGRVTQHEYDSLGLRVKATFPDSAVLVQSYDDAGRLTAATDARGNTTTFQYDNADRLIAVRDALDNETVYGYDGNGNRTSVTDARGNTTTYEYDAVGRLTRVLLPDGSQRSMAYDQVGRKLSETDAAGNVTRFGYDGAGRLASVTDALNQVTRYLYDEVGNLITRTDGLGRVTRYEYDSRGRLTKRSMPLGAVETLEYDGAGNLTRRTNFRGEAIQYQYDLNNRLVRRGFPDGSSASFTYTATGKRASMTDARGTTTYVYDPQDRLTQITDPGGRVLRYAYDLQGNRTRLEATVGGSTLVTTYQYDALNRLKQVTDPQERAYSYGYDAKGNLVSLAYPNNVTTGFSRDLLDRVVNLVTQTGAGTVLQSYAYDLDPTGRRTRVDEHDGAVHSYSYDTLFRLTGESLARGGGPVYADSFSYDALGNRLSRQRTGAAPSSYVYDDRDRLVSLDGSVFSWDANGDLLTKPSPDGAVYHWDFEDRLVRVEKTDGTVVTHAYDADGNRVRTEITPPNGPPAVTEFLIDPAQGLSHVVADIDAGGNVSAYYVRGHGLLSVLRPGGTRFFHSDGLGSVRALTDESGTVTDRYEYEAFGQLLSHQGSDSNPYLFAGERLDFTTGLYDLRARWMDPVLGRFVSSDPFEGDDSSPLTLHDYLYAVNDPVNQTDPSGLFVGGVAEMQVAMSIRSGLAQMQSDLGFLLIDAAQGNGNQALASLLIGPALGGAVALTARGIGLAARLISGFRKMGVRNFIKYRKLLKGTVRGFVLSEEAIAKVWKLDPRERGKAIEAHLAITEYDNYVWTGIRDGGMNQLDDFESVLANGSEVVQLKTVSRKNMDGAISGLLDTMENLAAHKKANPSTSVTLDIRTEPGKNFSAEGLKQLEDEAKNLGVNLKILPFP